MHDAEVQALASQVLWAAFVLAVLFGAIAQRTHFCTMGALSDVVSMGDWSRMRQWALAAGVAVLGFNAMAGLGWVEAGKSIYAAPRLLWLSHAVGGLMFGFGMVLASGCGSKTLVRLGGGNLKALVRAIARRPEFLADATIFNRTKSPVERIVAATRLLRWPGLRNDVSLPWMLARLAQHPMTPPNVSGWPKGDQWLNASNLHVWGELANELATRGFDWSGAQVGPISPTVAHLHADGPAATAAGRATVAFS